MKCPQDKAKNSLENNKNSNLSPSDIICVCPKCVGLYVMNKKSGQLFPAKCKSYGCEFCGPGQQKRLRLALENYVKNWDWCRMFTFTFRSNIFVNLNIDTQIKNCSEVWRRFLIYYKRSKSLTKFNKDFKYIKTIEFTKEGHVHYHVIIDRYFPLEIAHKIFALCVNQVFYTSGTNSNIHISKETNQTKKQNLYYLVKYVTKSAKKVSTNMRFRKWSKNKKGSIFPPKINNPDFCFINLRGNGIDLEDISLTSQQNSENFSIFDVLDFDFIEKPPILEEIRDDDPFWDYFL